MWNVNVLSPSGMVNGMNPEGFADAHIHIAEQGSGYRDIGRCEVLFGCTARPSDWDAMASCDRYGVVRFYGVHPWYADEWGPESMERLSSILDGDPDANVGEIGMDSKRGDVTIQEGVFSSQLSMASERGRIANVHMVGCEKPVLDTVRRHGRGCRAVILHSFSSESYVKPFAEAGCMFSINPRILRRSPERVSRLVLAIPRDRLLVETDSPYVPAGFDGMDAFISALADAVGMDAGELASITLDNAGRLSDV